MKEEQYDENNFEVTVNGKIYSVKAVSENVNRTRFKIETEGRYLFTLIMNEEGNWQTEHEVTPYDEALMDKIGRAIEEHDIR